MNLRIYSFAELDPNLLYSILRLRQQVFVIEQQSIYDDIDNLDQDAMHLCIHAQSTADVLGYLRFRLVQAAKIMKIERVVVGQPHRCKGIAKLLLNTAIEQAHLRQIDSINLSAQCDVTSYYQQWGFTPSGTVYDDGGIDHMDMTLSLKRKTPSQ
jgi:ElaA protein